MISSTGLKNLFCKGRFCSLRNTFLDSFEYAGSADIFGLRHRFCRLLGRRRAARSWSVIPIHFSAERYVLSEIVFYYPPEVARPPKNW